LLFLALARRISIASAGICLYHAAHASSLHPSPQSAKPFSTEAEACIIPAAQFHGVNYQVLRAILVSESSLKSRAISKNSNGTIDVGIGQTNRIHFKELGRYGIGPDQLLDACVSTYVAAWQLRKHIASHGNTWEAIARYHSGTPAINRRYQVLIQNELVRSGAMEGSVQPLPSVPATSQIMQRAKPEQGVLIVDSQ